MWTVRTSNWPRFPSFTQVQHESWLRNAVSPLPPIKHFRHESKTFSPRSQFIMPLTQIAVNVTNLYNLPPKITLINKIIFLRKKFVHCVRDFNIINININMKLIVELTKRKFRSKVNFHGNGNVARVFILFNMADGYLLCLLTRDFWFIARSRGIRVQTSPGRDPFESNFLKIRHAFTRGELNVWTLSKKGDVLNKQVSIILWEIFLRAQDFEYNLKSFNNFGEEK